MGYGSSNRIPGIAPVGCLGESNKIQVPLVYLGTLGTCEVKLYFPVSFRREIGAYYCLKKNRMSRQQVLHFSLDKMSSQFCYFPSENKEPFVPRPDVKMLAKYYINQAKNLTRF